MDQQQAWTLGWWFQIICLITFLLTLLYLPMDVQAAEEKGKAKASQQTNPSEDLKVLDSIEYPELQVVPRATQRLQLEANNEKKNFWYVHWPYYLSAIATIYSANEQKSHLDMSKTAGKRNEAEDRLQISSLVGYGWLLGMAVLSFDRPYRDGMGSVGKISGQSREANLMRERMAEEALEKSARLMDKLKWFSVASNLLANSVALGETTDEGKAYAGVGILFSFFPLIFEHQYSYNFEKHQEYKRKIYAPNLHLDVYPSSQLGRTTARVDWVRGLKLTWMF